MKSSQWYLEEKFRSRSKSTLLISHCLSQNRWTTTTSTMLPSQTSPKLLSNPHQMPSSKQARYRTVSRRQGMLGPWSPFTSAHLRLKLVVSRPKAVQARARAAWKGRRTLPRVQLWMRQAVRLREVVQRCKSPQSRSSKSNWQVLDNKQPLLSPQKRSQRRMLDPRPWPRTRTLPWSSSASASSQRSSTWSLATCATCGSTLAASI